MDSLISRCSHKGKVASSLSMCQVFKKLRESTFDFQSNQTFTLRESNTSFAVDLRNPNADTKCGLSVFLRETKSTGKRHFFATKRFVSDRKTNVSCLFESILQTKNGCFPIHCCSRARGLRFGWIGRGASFQIKHFFGE